MFPQRPRPRPPMPPTEPGRPHLLFHQPRPPVPYQQMGQNPPSNNPIQALQSLFQGNQQNGQQPGHPQQLQSSNQQQGQMQALMGMFQTEDGNWDVEKIISTAQQVNGVYKQVSPLITQFFNK